MSGLFSGTPLEQPVTCEHCGNEITACTCPRDPAGNLLLPTAQHPRVRRERRRGKWCTIVTGLAPVVENGTHDHKALLRTLRTSLGTGGGLDGEDLIIQGDHRDAIVARLRQMGYNAKAAGG